MRLRMILTLLFAPIAAGLADASLALASTPLSGPIAAESGPISDEQSTTYWAYAVTAAPVRSAPSARARSVGSVHLYTEDGFAEDYLVLAQEVYPRLTLRSAFLDVPTVGRDG